VVLWGNVVLLQRILSCKLNIWRAKLMGVAQMVSVKDAYYYNVITSRLMRLCNFFSGC